MEKPTFDPTPDASQVQEHLVPVDVSTMTALEDSKPVKPARRRRRAAPIRVAVEVDLSPAVMTGGYATRVVDDLVLNTTPQRAVLKLLTASLYAHKATLVDGTPIVRPQQALAWLLEQIAVGMPSAVLDELVEAVQ